MTGKKKLICFFVIFLLVNAFGLAENEKIQTERSWKSENYVALENENNRKLIKSVSSSGNRNWGVFFAVAADKIQEKYGIPVLMKFELSGTNTEVENYINYLENNYK